jgi:hypothetical protein
MIEIKITIEGGLYALRSPKDFKLIEALKTYIPTKHRAWSGETFAWMIHPSAVEQCKQAIKAAGYDVPEFPPIGSQEIAAPVQRTLRVEYIGQCKEREGGAVSALATTNASNPYQDYRTGETRYQWAIEFPESVLKSFFEMKPAGDTGSQTFYQILCVFETASDEEIKKAHRRLALQWHPDRCREENAADMFRSIDEAYKGLRDPQMRRRYDAGLYFEREARKPALNAADPSFDFNIPGRRRRFENKYFRAPFRCGVVAVEGSPSLKRFVVSKISSWRDIEDGQGRVMITSWSKQTNSIEVQWS